MDFSFGRKRETSWKSDETKSSFRTSLTEGSSRLFGSVLATKNGLLDGISNKFDQVVNIVGGGDDDVDSDDDRKLNARTPSPQSVTKQTSPKVRPGDVSPRGRQQTIPAATPKPSQNTFSPQNVQANVTSPRVSVGSSPVARNPPPGRPPAPRTSRSSVGSEDALETSGSTQPNETIKRQNSAPVGYEPRSFADPVSMVAQKQEVSGVSDKMAINFDTPLYGDTASNSSSTAVSPPEVFESSISSNPPVSTGQPPVDPQAPEPPPRVLTKRPPMKRRNTNPFLNDDGTLIEDESYKPVVTSGEVTFAKTTEPAYNQPPDAYSSTFTPPRNAAMPSDTSGGSDLLPGIPSITNEATQSFLTAGGSGQDLLAITPTTRESLPPPQMEPEQTVPETRATEVFDDSDGDSEATEGCDDVADAAYDPERDFEEPMFRSGSVGSDQSWTSSLSADSQMDEMGHIAMEFMKVFVDANFDICAVISPLEKARFGELCQCGPGRLWFARYINAQRVNNKKVEEQIFYRLVQHFAVALFECNEAEDFVPAKILMNMCFTFYFEALQPNGTTFKHFLYSYLKDQPIWQSLRFWNAAFFDAVQHERARKPLVGRNQEAASRDDNEYQENVTFGQLGTFTCNMCAFGLSKELCLEFLRKQASLANLRDEQIQMLRDNIARWSEQR